MAVPRSTKDLEEKGVMNARKDTIKREEEVSGKMTMIEPVCFITFLQLNKKLRRVRLIC